MRVRGKCSFSVHRERDSRLEDSAAGSELHTPPGRCRQARRFDDESDVCSALMNAKRRVYRAIWVVPRLRRPFDFWEGGVFFCP